MDNSIIYEKHYSKVGCSDAADDTVESTKDATRLNFEQIMEKIHRDVVYVPLPEKQTASKEFLKTAIAISTTYEIDVKILQHLERIEVKYYFDYAVSVGFLKDVIMFADDISFFEDVEGFNLVLSLDFYTHAVYRKERCIIP